MDLIEAAMQGNIAAVRDALEKGTDINIKSNDSGRTALMHASFNGHTETVKLLIEKGAGVHARTHSGKTALTLASDKGHMEIVRILKPYNGQS